MENKHKAAGKEAMIIQKQKAMQLKQKDSERMRTITKGKRAK